MTEETHTEIFLPPSFPYPIKISSIDAPASGTVQRGARLLSYSLQATSPRGRPETRFGTWDRTWDCAIDGPSSRGTRRPEMSSLQHKQETNTSYKDMTNSEYIGFSDTSRASTQMTHSTNGPTVPNPRRIDRDGKREAT
ncbi:hypothetical protein IW261DRAFT_1562868 [Armillaria novae-zelandiae]|uniref:Uncharacterized protein n=1 Tax=Armillaria novae-zelandiae TaxID=153914 RepID=A0AA39PCM2_9AGAR|nr:hypothetical protein IW261DRAFT_1562868 [Armillaria novae-zelandiae]